MKTPSPRKQQHGLKRLPSTPLSPLKRDHHRRRKLNTETAILTQAPDLTANKNNAPSTATSATSATSESSHTTARRLYLQQFQIERLSSVVSFLEQERKLTK
ncbi:hypothetical protein C6P40_000408 [Pichia californica]|uniref:Uncharacterized protein n=1 Tax=Pichia californica TaxID=460514 RepID=A0A9P6WKL5_9ASCO|nr:hypothetical protein C6P42_002250 [[Candida] californica]KAG0688875.1 hypothetical protein C6P40_000408 [[Candida] californica]